MNRTAAYNHGGKILFSRNWPSEDQLDFLDKMKFLLRIEHHVPIDNPEELPEIPEGEFLDLKDYNYTIYMNERGQFCSIIDPNIILKHGSYPHDHGK